jgi:hypothetical protein
VFVHREINACDTGHADLWTSGIVKTAEKRGSVAVRAGNCNAGLGQKSALALLVARIGADDAHHTVAPHDAALITQLLD